jgi:hypothetical protein
MPLVVVTMSVGLNWKRSRARDSRFPRWQYFEYVGAISTPSATPGARAIISTTGPTRF